MPCLPSGGGAGRELAGPALSGSSLAAASPREPRPKGSASYVLVFRSISLLTVSAPIAIYGYRAFAHRPAIRSRAPPYHGCHAEHPL